MYCHSETVDRIYKDHLTLYRCNTCQKISNRCLVIDNKIVWWIDEKENYWHESVGVIVINEDQKILCMLRQIFPFSYTIPAGHLDKWEVPEHAALRELEEETGIKTKGKLELIEEFNIYEDSCRRGSDHHKWHLYKLRVANVKKIELSDETSTADWYHLSELEKMKNLTDSLKFIIKRFGKSLI